MQHVKLVTCAFSEFLNVFIDANNIVKIVFRYSSFDLFFKTAHHVFCHNSDSFHCLFKFEISKKQNSADMTLN